MFLLIRKSIGPYILLWDSHSNHQRIVFPTLLGQDYLWLFFFWSMNNVLKLFPCHMQNIVCGSFKHCHMITAVRRGRASSALIAKLVRWCRVASDLCWHGKEGILNLNPKICIICSCSATKRKVNDRAHKRK